MAGSSPIRITQTPPETELQDTEHNPKTTTPKHSTTPNSNATPTVTVDKTMASAANLIKLLPTGTVLAFNSLSPSFTNHGRDCYPSHKYLTAVLLAVCAVSCVFLSFTDSFVGRDGKLYYGTATYRGMFVFNDDGNGDEEKGAKEDLSKYKIRWIDYIHAFFSVMVFVTVALSDTGVQGCLFAGAGPNQMALLVNLPLGTGFFSTLVFLVFPTSRRGIGYTDSNTSTR